MKDDRSIITAFCKIIQRFPDLYDHNADTYRRWSAETAWQNVAQCVRSELNEACTVDELKSKWKGLRSSYNRYKMRVYKSKIGANTRPFRNYYLHNTLSFLDPFIKPKGKIPPDEQDNEIVFQECYGEGVLDDSEIGTEYLEEAWGGVDIKPNIVEKSITKEDTSESETEISSKPKKKRHEERDKDDDKEQEDLQFFKSILPDIKDFTPKEKRKLKMNILKLIDEIDNERKNTK